MKSSRNGKVQCKGYGKCITLEMDVLEEEETKELMKENMCYNCDNKSSISDLFKTPNTKTENSSAENSSVCNKEDMEEGEANINKLPTLRTIFRYEMNEMCKFKCTLQKCENYTTCGNSLPQWVLNLGRGYCEQCNFESIIRDSDVEEKQRRFTI